MKLCASCGLRPAERRYDRKGYRRNCLPCRRKPWSRFKGDVCEECGFVPEHICQLDVDHIDGDKTNNDPSNLQTLCANCHRLKTWDNEDFGVRA